jgi:hypothetical protein
LVTVLVIETAVAPKRYIASLITEYIMRIPTMSFQNNRLLLSVFSLLLLVIACKKDAVDTADCSGFSPTYTADIKPILDASCALSGCHDSISQQDGKNLSTYEGALAVSQNDEFLGAIQHKSGYEPMPQGGPKLADATIELITCWVQNGSPQ